MVENNEAAQLKNIQKFKIFIKSLLSDSIFIFIVFLLLIIFIDVPNFFK